MHENHPPPATAVHNNNVHPRTYLIHLPVLYLAYPPPTCTILILLSPGATFLVDRSCHCGPSIAFFEKKPGGAYRKGKTEENRKEKKGKGEKRFKDGGRRTDLRTSLERTDQTEHGVIFRTIAIATRYRSTLPGRF